MTKPIALLRTRPRALITLLLTAWAFHGLALAAEPASSAAPIVVVTPMQAAEPADSDHRSDAAPANNPRKPAEVGRQTRQWVQAQGAREQATSKRPTLSGPVLRKTHDRYLRSFDNEIPQQLRESMPDNK